MNKVIEMGRFTADPELKKTRGDGLSVCSFTIAVNRPGSDKTDFLDCVAWRSTAEFICKWFEKGSPVIVEGSLRTRIWEDKAGQKRKAVEIVVDNVFFIPRAKASKNEQEPATVEHENDFTQNATFCEIDDEDLPY